ncbi:MAG: hypothetical protein HY296_03660 [Thaumarchaeota archaeon]|nr:hypothetical protein [Nitrososphaerota archaeon]
MQQPSWRSPASVLAKHYVDLSLQKLKQAYDQAALTVLDTASELPSSSRYFRTSLSVRSS